MSETKQLPAIIDAIGRAWFLCARHDEGQDITGRKFYGERAATTDDIAAVLAALTSADRAPLIAKLVDAGHWPEIDDACDAEAQKVIDMTDEELAAEIAASCEHPDRYARLGQATGRWIRMVADATGRARESEIRAAKLESELSACTIELNDERAKVGLIMQPMPGETFPGESSPVWRMLQQWTANRDVEKRAERERVNRLESELSAEREGRRVEQVALADARAWFRNYCELVRFHPDDFTAEEARQRAFDDLTRLANASPPSPPPAEVCGTCGGSGAMFPRMNSGIGSPRYRVTCNICRGSGVSPGAKGEA